MKTEQKFAQTFCSQCGEEFGPGNGGYSHCSDHMTAPKWTPGAWTTKYDPSTHRIEINAAEYGRCVSFIHVPPATGHDVCEANAHLIAAAPELYAALENILAIIDASCGIDGWHRNGDVAEWGQFEEIDTARAALAKAEGRTDE
jgi:hypothetical protein